GGADAFLARFGPAGDRQWVHELGTTANDYGNGVVLDVAGNAFMAGTTFGEIVIGPGGVDPILAVLAKCSVPAPTNLAIASPIGRPAGSLSLSWDAAPGASSYNVLRGAAGMPITQLTTVSGPSFTDTALANGTRYFYRVEGVGSDGCMSDDSATAS